MGLVRTCLAALACLACNTGGGGPVLTQSCKFGAEDCPCGIGNACDEGLVCVVGFCHATMDETTGGSTAGTTSTTGGASEPTGTSGASGTR